MARINSRDDWDYEVLDAFLQRPRPEAPDDAVFLAVAGQAFRRYARACAPSIAHLTGLRLPAITRRLVAANARYYRAMAGAIATGPAELAGWDRCRQQIAAHLRGPSVIVTFQLGLPLLMPLAANASRCRTAVFMHSRNPHAHRLMKQAMPPVEVLDVEESSAFGALRALRSGSHVVANIDTAYEGTRAIAVKFFGGSVEAPAGLVTAVPRRLGVPVFSAAIVMTEQGLEASIATIDPDDAASQLSSFFGPIVRAHPFQWMGWGSFRM